MSKMFLMCLEMTDLSRWKRSAIWLRASQTDSWMSRDRQRRKQAEFLVWQSMGWSLIESIAVFNQRVKQDVEIVLGQHPDRPQPRVETRPEWYY